MNEHYRDSHDFCDRCERSFVSAAAQEEHYQNSLNHWMRESHMFDYPTRKELYQHYKSDPSHFWCPWCSQHYDTAAQLQNVSQI